MAKSMDDALKPRKLWIVNQYATPPSLPGITRHYSLGKHLVEMGWDVTVFTSNYRHETRKNYIPNLRGKMQTVEFGGVKFVFVRQHVHYQTNGVARILNILEFGKNVYQLMVNTHWQNKPDIIIGSSFHFLNVEAAFKVAKRTGAVPFLEIRDLWPEALVYLRGISRGHPVVRLLMAEKRKLYKLSRGVITLSKAIESDVKTHFPQKPTLVSPNPVDLQLFSSIDLDQWKQLAPFKQILNSSAKTKLIYIGTVGEANAFEVIFQTAVFLRNFDIDFFVVGHGEKFREYKARSEKEGLRIFFHAPVPKQAIPTLLSLADGLVAAIHPSFALYGGSMNKLNDYMAAGKPIFYSGPKANTPFEEVDCAVLVEPFSPQALAHEIKKFHSSPTLFKKKASLCKKYVVNNYSSSALAMRLSEFLERHFDAEH